MTEKFLDQSNSQTNGSNNLNSVAEFKAEHGVDEADISETLDARGLACPMPLLKAKLLLNQLSSGELLKVLATDGGSERDFPVFAKLSGHPLLVARKQNDVYIYVIKKVEA